MEHPQRRLLKECLTPGAGLVVVGLGEQRSISPKGTFAATEAPEGDHLPHPHQHLHQHWLRQLHQLLPLEDWRRATHTKEEVFISTVDSSSVSSQK